MRSKKRIKDICVTCVREKTCKKLKEPQELQLLTSTGRIKDCSGYKENKDG